MNFTTFCFLLLFVFSCKSINIDKNKHASTPSPPPYVSTSGTSNYDNIWKDIEKLSSFDKISAPSPPNNEEMEYEDYNLDVKELQLRSKRITSSKNIKIENKIDSVKLKKGNGIISYHVPNKVEYNKDYIFRLRITANNKISIEKLIIGDRDIPIYDSNTNGKIIIEDIKISKYMSAYLWASPEGFDVQQLSTVSQKLDKETYTEWSWKIKPIKKGKYIIKMFVNIDDKDLTVYEKEMEIAISTIEQIWIFMQNNISWLWSTIIVPFIIPFLRKKLKKE